MEKENKNLQNCTFVSHSLDYTVDSAHYPPYITRGKSQLGGFWLATNLHRKYCKKIQ